MTALYVPYLKQNFRDPNFFLTEFNTDHLDICPKTIHNFLSSENVR